MCLCAFQCVNDNAKIDSKNLNETQILVTMHCLISEFTFLICKHRVSKQQALHHKIIKGLNEIWTVLGKNKAFNER